MDSKDRQDLGSEKEGAMLKKGTLIATLALLVVAALAGPATALTPGEFNQIIQSLATIPYNPRPIATETSDVTGISEDDTRAAFLSAFTRVEIPAPANGRTFKATNSANHDDITIVGYLRTQPGSTPPAGWPWVILTHGGAGQGSIGLNAMLLHLANVLYANGWNVLAVDKRDGLLSRCGYGTTDADGDGDYDAVKEQSVANRVGDTNQARFCETLPAEFRKPGYEANSLPSSRSAFEAGDLLAAAKYVRDTYGAPKIALLGGSHGGLAAIRAAAIMGTTGVDFRGDLLDAIVAISPVADHNTIQYDSSSRTFECDRASAAKFYSENINDTGLSYFSNDPVHVLDEFYAMLHGVSQLDAMTIPTLIVWTLADETDVARSAFAYAAKTAKMKLAYTMVMSRLGHFDEIWRSDAYWMEKTMLTYFKSVLEPSTGSIGINPGFSSGGSRTSNPYLLNLNLNKYDPAMFLSQDSISSYLVGAPDGTCRSEIGLP